MGPNRISRVMIAMALGCASLAMGVAGAATSASVDLPDDRDARQEILHQIVDPLMIDASQGKLGNGDAGLSPMTT